LALLAATALGAPGCSPESGADNAAANVQTNEAAPKVAAANLPDADPAMWVVRDEDTTIYLFGTFHLLDGKTDWLNDEVRQAFDRARSWCSRSTCPRTRPRCRRPMAPLVMRYAMTKGCGRYRAA
jgi:hypothetical protein